MLLQSGPPLKGWVGLSGNPFKDLAMRTQAHKTGACLLAKMQSDAALGYSGIPPRLGVSLDSRTAAAGFHQRN